MFTFFFLLFYSTKTFQQTNSLTLLTTNIEEVKAMFHYRGENGGHVIVLFEEESSRAATLFHLPEDAMSSKKQFEPEDIIEKCFCAAAVDTLDG